MSTWVINEPVEKPAGRREKESAPLDAVRFARERLGFDADGRQEAFLLCGAKQVILNCSRQWGKSTLAAVKAVHRAYCEPKSLTIVASVAERQSAEFLLKVREFLSVLNIDRKGDGHNRVGVRLPNGSRIIGLPGKEATTRGFSAASLLIVDEAARVDEELYKALRPMLTTKNGDVWLLSTPNGKRGFFHEQWEFGGDEWTRFRVPATECPRIKPARLEVERRQMGDAWFRQEYMCEFNGTESQLFDSSLVSAALEDGEEWISGPGVRRVQNYPFVLAAKNVFVGLDLGQTRDHSAIAVVEKDERPSAYGPSIFQGMRVRYLERMPLLTPYWSVEARVGQILSHSDLGIRKRLVADATGVGAPVVDSLRRAQLGCPVTAVTITGGDRARAVDSNHWHVPKKDLMAGLLLLLQEGQLKIVRSLKEAGTLVRELNDVEMRYKASGGVSIGANGSGEHDDLVIAVALACWRARQKENGFGTQRLL